MRGALFLRALFSLFAVTTSSIALADASVSVGDEGRFARPPREADPPAVVVAQPEAPAPLPIERYRSPFRLSVGPAMFVAGSDVGLGLGVAADFGTGTVGGRISAAWLRAQKQGSTDAGASPIGNGFGQYTAEITLDFMKRGPVHPMLGLGFGGLHVFHPVSGDLVAGVGTARAGLEYALSFDDADVRVSAFVSGAMLGPAPHALQDLKGYGLFGASIGIGF